MRALLRRMMDEGRRTKDEGRWTKDDFVYRLSSIVYRNVLLVIAATVLLTFVPSSNTWASPDKAVFVSPLVWRSDDYGDYNFEDSVRITGGGRKYELATPYITAGQIKKISASWSFTGEATLQVSATGKAKDYVSIINGVPLEEGLFTTGNRLIWKAALSRGSRLTEVRIAYTDTSGVIGSFGNPELSGFMFKKPVYITGGEGDLFHYQVPIKIGESANSQAANVILKGVIQANFADCRFTAADGETLLPYWLEDITGESPNRTATFWVKVPHVPQEGLHVYLYYGNPDARDLSDGEGVFDFFDDFQGDTLDTDKWDAVPNAHTSIITPTYDGLRLDGALVKSSAYEFTDGIIEYKAKSSLGDAIVGVIRGGSAGAQNQTAYSSQSAGSEHCIIVGEEAKANTPKGISPNTYYNYRIIADGKNLTFQRYSSDKNQLQAEVKYTDRPGLAKGYVGLSTLSTGKEVYYARIFVRRLVPSPAAVDVAKTKTGKEEAPNVAGFQAVTIAPNGNLVLEEGRESGKYVSPLIHASFKARVIVPGWTMDDGRGTKDEGGIAIDISAKEYGVFTEGCANGSYYYASKKDFTEGDALRWRARFVRGSNEGRGTKDEGRNPSLEQFTMDYRRGAIKLISPNGGEYAIIGESYTIKWNAADYGPEYNMKLEYSTDGGIKFNTITSEAANTGAYLWDVPDAASEKAVVRVSDSFDTGVYDTSDNYFSIVYEIPEEGEYVTTDEGRRTTDEEVAEEEPETRTGTALYELLIKIGDNAGYRDGDIIMIKPAGFLWGAEEKEKFLIVKAYLTEKEVEELMKPETRLTVDKNGNRVLEIVQRRKHKVNFEKTHKLFGAKTKVISGFLQSKPLVDISEIEEKQVR